MSDESLWNDKSKVFETPSSIIEYRAANIAHTVDDYISKVDGNFKNYTIFMDHFDLGNNGPYPDYKEATKFWGYITPPETNDYYFGTQSDDGSQGYIIVNDSKIQIVDQFKIHGTEFKTDNNKMHLEKGKYYPIYLEYSNWGGDGEFRLLYKNTKFNINNDQAGGTTVPAEWFRPSSNTNPGEVSTATFESTAVKGIPFPEQTNTYYLAFKAENEMGGVREGIYGPFLVDKTMPTGTFTINPSTGTNGNVTITLNASDEHSGVRRIRKSEGDWVNEESNSYTVTENRTYSFEVEDNAGNVAILECPVSNIDNSIIRTGLFLNNKFSEQSNISIVKGFNLNLAIEITNFESKEIKLEMNDYDGFIDISNIEVYASEDLKNPNRDANINVSGKTITITNLPIDNNQYIVVLKAKAVEINTENLSNSIKIDGNMRIEKHLVNVVELPELE